MPNLVEISNLTGLGKMGRRTSLGKSHGRKRLPRGKGQKITLGRKHKAMAKIDGRVVKATLMQSPKSMSFLNKPQMPRTATEAAMWFAFNWSVEALRLARKEGKGAMGRMMEKILKLWIKEAKLRMKVATLKSRAAAVRRLRG